MDNAEMASQMMPQSSSQDESYDADIKQKLMAVKDAISSGDIEAAMALIDECLATQDQDINQESETPDIQDQLSQAYDKKGV